MSGGKSQTNESELMLGLLKAVHENEASTQRVMAQQVGMALGLVNTYLKRCIKKGYIKVVTAPRSRYSYYLTPKGFAEKSRLTAEYLSVSFNLLRHARTQYTELFAQCRANGWTRIAFAGTGDLAEIAMMCLNGSDLELVGFISRAPHAGHHLEKPVFGDALSAGGANCDAILVADLKDPQGTFDWLAPQFPNARILAPDLLNVSRDKDAKE